jgi:hypothetical protein
MTLPPASKGMPMKSLTQPIAGMHTTGFGTDGIAYRGFNLNGPHGSHGWSSHVEALPNNKELVCVGVTSDQDRRGTPKVVACLLYDLSGRTISETLVLPESGEVAEVCGIGFIDDTEWLIVCGNTTNLLRPFLLRVHVRSGEVDRNFERNFNVYIHNAWVRGLGIRIESLLLDQDGSVIVSGSVIRRTEPGVEAAVLRFHPDGSPRSVIFCASSERDEDIWWCEHLSFSETGLIVSTVGAKKSIRFDMVLFLDTEGEDPEASRPSLQLPDLDRVAACSCSEGETMLAVGCCTESVGDTKPHAAIQRITRDSVDKSSLRALKAPDTRWRAICMLEDNSAIVAGDWQEHPLLGRYKSDGDWEPTFPGEGYIGLHDFEGSGTDVTLVDQTVVMNVRTRGEGLVLMAFPIIMPDEPTTPVPARTAPAQDPAPALARTANPYAGWTVNQIEQKGKADHAWHMTAMNLGMQDLYKKMGGW